MNFPKLWIAGLSAAVLAVSGTYLWREGIASNGSEEIGPQRACIMQTREETNTGASRRSTPLAVPLATERNPSKRECRGICSFAKCSGSGARFQCWENSRGMSVRRFGE